MRRQSFMLGKNQYTMKPMSKKAVTAHEKIQKFLQQEENKKFGKKAQKVTFAYVTNYVYENYLRGKEIR